MKKIMFDDKYGLTEAVLEGRKTMTRRFVGDKMTNDDIVAAFKYPEIANSAARYKIGEVVAVAQPYKKVFTYTHGLPDEHKGCTNKMFVRADLMPHQIRITDIKVERLQDISDEDCLKEGIMEGEFMNTWDRFYYDSWGDVPNHITFKTPRAAFAALIDKISGRGTWDSNPLVFAYSFELIK